MRTPRCRGLTAWLTRPLASFHLVLAVWGLLTMVGLVMVASASVVDSINHGGGPYTIVGKQFECTLAGLVVFWLVLRMSPRTLRRISLGLVLVSLALLAAVLLVGTDIHGARKWFTLGSLSLQPVEPAKLALVLWGAHMLAAKRQLQARWGQLLTPVVPVALLMFALIMLQPDLGSTITLAIILLALLWFAGARPHLFVMLVLGAVTSALVLAMTAHYRSSRIASFLHSGVDPLGASYQVDQARVALGSGGLFGVGLGQGSVTWRHLPNVHNDFIFAVIGEQLGLVGCLVVLLLFGVLAYVGLRIALRSTDPWNQLVSATLTVWLVGQAAINIGSVAGLLPVTGIPLPLISSGGTSVVTTMAVFGILGTCARHEPDTVAALRTRRPSRVGRLSQLPLPEAYRPPRTR